MPGISLILFARILTKCLNFTLSHLIVFLISTIFQSDDDYNITTNNNN